MDAEFRRKRLKAVATDQGIQPRDNEEWFRKGGVTQIIIPVGGMMDKDGVWSRSSPGASGYRGSSWS